MAYPNSLDSFTTKTDGIDDVMAADINSIQSAVVAVETELGMLPKGLFGSLASRLAFTESGYFRMATAGTYVSATSFTLSGDFTAFFKIGVKVRLVNSGTRYGYCLSSSYTSGLTTVNLVYNDSYSLVSAAITNIDISYGNPPDFPYWFAYTPAITGQGGTAGTFAMTNKNSRFAINGRTLMYKPFVQITDKGSWTLMVDVSLPVSPQNTTNNTPVYAMVYAWDTVFPHGAGYKAIGRLEWGLLRFMTNANVPYFSWDNIAVNDYISGNFEYEI